MLKEISTKIDSNRFFGGQLGSQRCNDKYQLRGITNVVIDKRTEQSLLMTYKNIMIEVFSHLNWKG